MESTELLHRALDHATAVVEAITPDQMSNKTPCREFDVRTLLNHTTASVQAFAGAATGDTLDMSLYGEDLIGDDPSGAFKQAADNLRAATANAAALTRPWGMPSGEMPGERAIAIPIIEVAQHGWDLARATKQPRSLDDAMAEEVLGIAKEYMPPDDQRPAEMFGPSVSISESAPPADRLAAFLGRKT